MVARVQVGKDASRDLAAPSRSIIAQYGLAVAVTVMPAKAKYD
jgi:hypothetical protein